MKFKFKFSSVEKHRKIMMDLARRDYLEAQNNVDIKLNEIRMFYSAIDNARERAAEGQLQSLMSAPELVQIDDFIKGQGIRIERARMEARELMTIAEEKHEVLLLKVQEHKAMIKLRERHLEEYRLRIKKLIQKRSDDQTVMRFKARG
jgi:flagellar export protein FliJ